VLWVECLAATVLARRVDVKPDFRRPVIAVLVPAHNEERAIEVALTSIVRQLRTCDRLLVVADNCEDNTAEVARRVGAEVVERFDVEHRGKGYALAYGIDQLRRQPPDVLVLVDADTSPDPGTIGELSRDARRTGLPVQAAYVFDPPPTPSARHSVSCFALTVKNLVRPAGLTRLSLPCQLTGSGIAIPWMAATAMLPDGANLVEDMQLGVDLAIAGCPPRFCSSAHVRGQLPQTTRGALTQRRRWEHGHMHTLLKQAPRLLGEALRQRRIDLLAMALDLAVPPLSLLFLTWVVAISATVLSGAMGGSWLPIWVLGAGGAMLVVSVLTAWSRYARGTVPLRTLLAAPLYAAWKIPLYLAFLVRRQRVWVRTERDEATRSCIGETRGR